MWSWPGPNSRAGNEAETIAIPDMEGGLPHRVVRFA